MQIEKRPRMVGFVLALIFLFCSTRFLTADEFNDKWRTAGPFEFTSSCMSSYSGKRSIVNPSFIQKSALIRDGSSSEFRLKREVDKGVKLALNGSSFSVLAIGSRHKASVIFIQNYNFCNFAIRSAAGSTLDINNVKDLTVSTDSVDRWIEKTIKKCEQGRVPPNVFDYVCNLDVIVEGAAVPSVGSDMGFDTYPPEETVPSNIARLPILHDGEKYLVFFYGNTVEVVQRNW